MKTKKFLSLVLAVIMIMSVLPMYASAADPIALTVANVTEWPVAEGELYVGQIYGEHITFVGGKVVYDGVEVPGHFEHFNATLSASLGSEAMKASMKFVPDDATAYKGFNILMSANVTFAVKKTTPVLKDDTNPPIASAIKEGQTLSESTISGGTMKNPYNDKLNISSYAWQWDDPNMVVTESGEYLAKWQGNTNSYETVMDYIYVEVEKDQKATTLKTMPVVNFDYNPDLTWGDYEFADASAVVYGTDTEVPGTFSIIDSWSHIVPGAGTYEVEVVFTPDDTENYIGFTTSVPVQINTIPVAFIGNDGSYIVDGFEFEVEPGTLMRDVQAYLMAYLNYPPQSIISVEDRNSYAENGRTYKLTVQHDNKNYVGTEVSFTVKFKDVEFAVSSASYSPSAEEIRVKFNSNKPNGTFDVYVDGKLIGDDVPRAGDHIDIPYKLETSGAHTVKVVYNPTENDYYFMADHETEIQANVRRSITLKDMSDFQKISVNGTETLPSSAYIVYGDEISINYGYEEFATWVITDAAGNAVALDSVDLTSKEITFTMPDHDLVISVKATLDEEEKPDDGTGSDDDANNGIFGSIWSFFRKLIDWFMNMIKQIMSLFAPKA